MFCASFPHRSVGCVYMRSHKTSPVQSVPSKCSPYACFGTNEQPWVWDPTDTFSHDALFLALLLEEGEVCISFATPLGQMWVDVLRTNWLLSCFLVLSVFKSHTLLFCGFGTVTVDLLPAVFCSWVSQVFKIMFPTVNLGYRRLQQVQQAVKTVNTKYFVNFHIGPNESKRKNIVKE